MVQTTTLDILKRGFNNSDCADAYTSKQVSSSMHCILVATLKSGDTHVSNCFPPSANSSGNELTCTSAWDFSFALEEVSINIKQLGHHHGGYWKLVKFSPNHSPDCPQGIVGSPYRYPGVNYSWHSVAPALQTIVNLSVSFSQAQLF